jgi:uncharacterized protein (TIGR02118 family)
MIKVSVMYPNGADTRFDLNYYLAKHMPMVQAKLGGALKKVEVDHGLGGAAPGESPAFVAMCHLHFESVDAFQQAFGANAEAIVADIPNYTNAQPTVLVSEVKL